MTVIRSPPLNSSLPPPPLLPVVPTPPAQSAPGSIAAASAPTELSTADVTWFGEMFRRLLANVARRLHGKDDQIGYALVALVSEGHILLEDVPGVGKTSLARAIAESVSGTWNRVQFTPDLLPSDITGVSIFNQATREFEFRPGPIFANIVIGDEINRTSPKTQSALLEVMEERRVTVDGVAHLVPRPFVVVATQNPVDMDAGTYALPEAQLDRFLLKMSMGYPDAVAEAGIVLSRHGGAPGPLDPVLSLTDIERMVTIGPRAHRPPGGAVHRVAGAGHPPDGGRTPRCQSARHDRAAARGPDDGRRGRPRLRDCRRRQAARRSGAGPSAGRGADRPAPRRHRRTRDHRPARPPGGAGRRGRLIGGHRCA